MRQPHGDGAGRAERAAAAQDRGVRPQLALRQPQTHHVLGAALAAARRIRARPAQLVALLDHGAALATTFSLTLGRGDQRDVQLCGHMRITGRSESELTTARRSLEPAARQAKTGLVRLDREQLPGVLATLPLGGAR